MIIDGLVSNPPVVIMQEIPSNKESKSNQLGKEYSNQLHSDH